MRKSTVLFYSLATCVLVTGVNTSFAGWRPPPPPPPPHINVPPPPPPPLPPFKIDSTSFLRHPGASIESAPNGAQCYANVDWLRIRGTNVNLATDVKIEGGPTEFVRQMASGDCSLNNCLGLYITIYPGTPPSQRTVSLKALDGRVIRTTFQITPATTRCDVPATNQGGTRNYPSTYSTGTTTSGAGGLAGSVSGTGTHTTPPTTTPVTTPAPQLTATTAYKGCQFGQTTLTGQPNFVTHTTQSIKVSVSFNSISSPCYCPSGMCSPPPAGSRTWTLRNSNGSAISIPWQTGDTAVPSVPPGSWKIELNEGSTPPGSYSVTYTP